MTILNASTGDSEARSVSQKGDPQHAGFTLKRRWEELNATSADALAVALNGITTYTDPQADRQTYTGSFIQSSLDPQTRPDDAVDIEQTLTKIKVVATDADADIVSEEGDPAVRGFKLNRAWHYISPYALDTLFPAVNAVTSYTNPKGNTETQTGKFIVSRNRSVEQTDRTYDILQDLVKVTTISNDTTLLHPLVDRAKDIIHPFGEGTGVGRDIIYRYQYLDPASDTKLMAISDTTLTAKMSQNDSFIHVSRKTQLQDDRTLTFWVLAQRKQRIAWGGRFGTPDHKENQYPTRDGEIRRKSWYGIDNDCYAGIKARLESAASADTGFSVMDVQVRDNDDGSDDWVQNSIRWFNDTQTDSRYINTHGLQQNVIQRRTYHDDNYVTLPAAPSLDTGFKYEDVQITKDNRGLLSRQVLTTKPRPTNTVTSQVPTSFTRTGIRNGDHDDIQSTGQVFTRMYDQVAIGSADTVMIKMDTSSDTNFIISDISYTDIGNGAARITQDRKRININGSWFIEEKGSANNNATKSLRRTWPFITDTYAAKIMLPDGLANDSFTYGNDSVTYLPIRAHRTKHYDGTSTVWQFGAEASSVVAAGGEGGGVAIRVGANTDSEILYSFIEELNHESTLSTYQKIFNNSADAKAFARRSTIINTAGGFKRMGSAQLINGGKWQGLKVVKV